MDSTVITRVATAGDAGELARFNGVFNRVYDSAETISSRLQDAGRVETPILAEIEGRAVGVACVRVVPCVFYATPFAELTELFVEETWRRRGAGRALVEHAERFARENGAAALLLLTGFANAEAQAFYRALGYADRDLAMEKKLLPS